MQSVAAAYRVVFCIRILKWQIPSSSVVKQRPDIRDQSGHIIRCFRNVTPRDNEINQDFLMP